MLCSLMSFPSDLCSLELFNCCSHFFQRPQNLVFLPAIPLLFLSSHFLHMHVGYIPFPVFFFFFQDLAASKLRLTRSYFYGNRIMDGNLPPSVFQVFHAGQPLMCCENGRALGIILFPPVLNVVRLNHRA